MGLHVGVAQRGRSSTLSSAHIEPRPDLRSAVRAYSLQWLQLGIIGSRGTQLKSRGSGQLKKQLVPKKKRLQSCGCILIRRLFYTFILVQLCLVVQ